MKRREVAISKEPPEMVQLHFLPCACDMLTLEQWECSRFNHTMGAASRDLDGIIRGGAVTVIALLM